MRPGGRLWWGLAPLIVLLWGSGALAVASLPGLPGSPWAVRLLLPVATFAHDLSASVAAGSIVLLLIRPTAPLRRWAVLWSASALVLVAVGVLLLRADLAVDVGWGTLLSEVVSVRTAVGSATAMALALVLLAVRVRWADAAALALVLIAAGLPALGSHAGLSGDHGAAGAAVALHVVGMSVWVGGLAALVSLAAVDGPAAMGVLPRFSVIALVCVLVVGETGLLAASLSAGSLSQLLGSTYGSIVLAKAVAFAWLVRLGWLQRRTALNRLPDSSALAVVVRIAGGELVIMGAALGAAVVLGRIGAPSIPTPGFAPLTLVALGLAAPLLLVVIRPRGWRAADALPEVAMIALLVVLVLVGGIGPGRRLLGGIGLLLELGLLVVAGWLAVSAARTPAARSALVVGMAGLPFALAAVVWLSGSASISMSVVALAAGEVCWCGGGARSSRARRQRRLWRRWEARAVTQDSTTPPPRPPRNRSKDFWQLDLPLALVLILCTSITVIEYRRANEGVWRAWIYLFEWPMIAAFAIWMWYRFKHDDGRRGFVQRWKDRVARYEAEDDEARQARAESAQREARAEAERRIEEDPELRRWREYQAGLSEQEDAKPAE